MIQMEIKGVHYVQSCSHKRRRDASFGAYTLYVTESEEWGLPLSLEPNAVLSPLFVCRYFKNCASVPGALIGVRWVDPDQAPTQAALSLPSTGERKFNKWFMG